MELSCEKKHILAEADLVQASHALGLSQVRNSNEGVQLVHDKMRVQPFSGHVYKMAMPRTSPGHLWE